MPNGRNNSRKLFPPVRDVREKVTRRKKTMVEYKRTEPRKHEQQELSEQAKGTEKRERGGNTANEGMELGTKGSGKKFWSSAVFGEEDRAAWPPCQRDRQRQTTLFPKNTAARVNTTTPPWPGRSIFLGAAACLRSRDGRDNAPSDSCAQLARLPLAWPLSFPRLPQLRDPSFLAAFFRPLPFSRLVFVVLILSRPR